MASEATKERNKKMARALGLHPMCAGCKAVGKCNPRYKGVYSVYCQFRKPFVPPEEIRKLIPKGRTAKESAEDYQKVLAFWEANSATIIKEKTIKKERTSGIKVTNPQLNKNYIYVGRNKEFKGLKCMIVKVVSENNYKLKFESGKTFHTALRSLRE